MAELGDYLPVDKPKVRDLMAELEASLRPSENRYQCPVHIILEYRLRCDLCGDVRLYNTHAEAAEGSWQHEKAHQDQPFCVCDQDGDDHAHCHHKGRCCHCPCLTRQKAPDQEAQP